ncbi:MAG: LysM peptidoglycan-binding domain-containing protein [Leptolyngbyaceae cyanobacterium MO_188.B28]|nr:LysM peptidoglycan-binding domain-containing protein [Leptolyngbyaceae cyanobacterium MO_188.B28]
MELTKLLIEAYLKNDRTGKKKTFELPINPGEITHSLKIEHDKSQAQGAQRNNSKYKRTPSETVRFGFTLDGTGVIPINKKPGKFYHDKPDDVASQLQAFLDTVYTMKGKIHRSNFLRLLWGKATFVERNAFDCVLSDLQINYTLFAPDGKPLRAKLSATFLGHTAPQYRNAEMKKGSPDITHERKIMGGDTLPLMAYDIYDDPTYYLQVAKANGLVNFRRLKTNTNMRFPPVEKGDV